jgi:fatty acid desaturase
MASTVTQLEMNINTRKTNKSLNSDKKSPRRHGFQPIHPDLWVIHGEYYDLSTFVQKHPGGEENLLLGKGRDCTELFESIHCLSKSNVKAILKKYKVKPDQIPEEAPPAPADTFTWKQGDFYDTLVQKVRTHFAGGNQNYKATWLYWLKVTGLFLAWMFCVRTCFLTGSFLIAGVAGFLMNMIGFCVMHDASHYGISKRAWINRWLHLSWNNWNLWNGFIWLRHHVYGHHSYTGIYRKDPDMANATLFFRKTHEGRFRPLHGWQAWSVWFVMTIIPNQHLGQAMVYSLTSGTVFCVPIEPMPWKELLILRIYYFFSLIFHFIVPFYFLSPSTAFACILAYWTCQGIGYFINIAPNHDTMETHHNLFEGDGEKRDWGVQQVLGSGNHNTGTGIWDRMVEHLWGGMNYQIEHHLFPSVSHMHYRTISKYVQETCEEFGIDYVTHSWFSACLSFGKLISLLGDSTINGDYVPPEVLLKRSQAKQS